MSRISREAFASLIPHAGSMCLLDEVTDYSENRIACHALSHLSADNPLRTRGQLSCLAGIEYAAQAMALHGALLARQRGHTLRQGFIGLLREVVCQVDRLDDIHAVLLIEATLVTGQSDSLMYAFAISAAGCSLLTGRVAVFFTDQHTLKHP